ncbi:opioid growth factor receptor-like isoform X2 [Lithobates pipiens]
MYSSAARDMKNYRHGYRHSDPSDRIDLKEMPNLSFYRNEISFKPNGYHIEDFLNKGKGDYNMLEHNHNYIQWLFPLQEPGVNPHAIPLHKKEIKEMKNDQIVMRNLLAAYKLMLGFYGLHLENEKTGEVCRAGNWEERYMNLNTHTHNNLRISRILKCLGDLGFERFQAPLVHFFLVETLCRGQLKKVKKSALDYFMFSVKDKRKRQDLVRFAWKHYEPKCEFVWGPVDLLRNDQVGLNRQKRVNCDRREEHGEENHKEDETRPPKIKKEIGQDDEQEHGNVNTSGCWTWKTLKTLSLRRKKGGNVRTKQNKPGNFEEKVTLQGKNRKSTGCFNCFQ